MLDNYSSKKVGSGNTLYVFGEIYNPTRDTLSLVKVAVNFFSTSGQLVGTDSGYISNDVLPEEKACFLIIVSDPPEEWSYYEFEPPNYYESGYAPPELTLLDVQYLRPAHDIIGRVRNDDTKAVEFVGAEATLYSSVVKVVDCDHSYTNNTTLVPEQVSAFQISFLYSTSTEVGSYSVRAFGRLQSEHN